MKKTFLISIMLMLCTLCFSSCTTANAFNEPLQNSTNSKEVFTTNSETSDSSDISLENKTTIFNDERFDHSFSGDGNTIWPVYGRVSKGYDESHKGVDIAAENGENIYVIADGTVTEVIYSDTDKGIYCIIEHDGYSSLYAHCSELVVEERQKVIKGELIAYVGNTGNSTGPHLHLEIVKNGELVNPYSVFSN